MKENNRSLRRHMRNQSQNWPESNANRFNNDRDFAERNGHRLHDGYNDDYRTHDNWEDEQDYYGNQYNNRSAFGQGSTSYGPDQYNEYGQGYENKGYGRPNRQNDEDMNYGSNYNRSNNWEDRNSNELRDQYNRGNQWANQWGNNYQGQGRNDQGRMGTTPGYDRQNQWNNNQDQWNNNGQNQWDNNSQNQWNGNRQNQWNNNDRQHQSNDNQRNQNYSQYQYNDSIGRPYATESMNRNTWDNNSNNNNNLYGNDRSWNNDRQSQSGSMGSSWGNMGNNDRSSSWMNNDRSSMNEGNNRGKGPRGYQRSEDRIKEDIHDRLSDDSYLDASDIEVSIENNNVVLSGKVESRTAKRRAEDIAESVSGVTNVENRLRVADHNQQSGKESGNTDKKQSDATNRMSAAGTQNSTDTTDKTKTKTTTA